jgi:dTDP-4-amino-4,6-dideoxygalactose transaminase
VTEAWLPSDQGASGRTLGEEELALLAEAIQSGTLTSTHGRFVRLLERSVAARLGVRWAHACSSGTAAVHAAVAALDPEPGDEIVTSPITDMGALAPILYQGAIPVFADVDPCTGLVTAKAIEARLSSRTRAVIVTHLFGRACDMTGIMRLARERNLPVIEDCAQAFLAQHRGRLAGTWGTLGCLSLQQGKHITTGEGGLVVTDDATLARRVFLFINKGWGYGDPEPDHYALGLNYRMSELAGAVGVAQLGKLEAGVERRIAAADDLSRGLDDLGGTETPTVAGGDVHTYWRYCLNVDSALVPGGPAGVARVLEAEGIASAPRYVRKPAFMCEVFRTQRTFGRSRYPFTLARPEAIDYDPSRFPGVFAALDRMLVLPWSERLTDAHVARIASAVRRAVEECAGGAR